MAKKQPRFFVPTEEANPTNSWKLLLAEAWENESGIPASFQVTLKQVGLELELVLGFP